MTQILPCAIPENALLKRYQRADAFADCYTTEVPFFVSHAEFVEAFYTTPLFKVERALLGWLARRPSTDAQVRELATGASEAFAAWQVEERAGGQLLVRAGRTRSWLMVAAGKDSTRLFFGSAVVAVAPRAGAPARMGLGFHALLGFHKLYSRLLLRAAQGRLAASRR